MNKVKDLLYEWILEEPSLNYRQKLQYFVGYLMISARILPGAPPFTIRCKKRNSESSQIVNRRLTFNRPAQRVLLRDTCRGGLAWLGRETHNLAGTSG